MPAIVRRVLSQLAKLLTSGTSAAAMPAAITDQVQLATLTYTTDSFIVQPGSGPPIQLTGPSAQGLPRNYIVGFGVSRPGTQTVRIQTGYARADDDTMEMFLNGVQDVLCTGVGANGLDAGALAGNTWYAIYVIGDSTFTNPVAGLVSASFTAPTMPAGYDKKRRVGVVRTGGAATFILFTQKHAGGSVATITLPGRRVRRYYWSNANATVLTGGTATVFTNVSLVTQAPPTAKNAVIDARHAPGTLGAATDVLTMRPAGATAADGPVVTRRGTALSATVLVQQFEMPLGANQDIEYKVTQGGANQNTASIRCMGFDDEI